MKSPNHRLYNIQNSEIYFHTGHLENGNQVLMGIQFPDIALLEFDPQGNYLSIAARGIPKQFLSVRNGIYWADDIVLQALIKNWQDEIGFIPGTISVKPFFLPDQWIGIQDLPDHYLEFLNQPENYDEERRLQLQEDIRQWRESGDFVLYWSEDYYLNQEGEVESS